MNSVADLLLARAAEHPRLPAVLHDDAAVSWAELAARAEALASRLQARGVKPGHRVAVDVGSAVAAAERLLAVWLADAIAVPLAAHLPPAEARRRRDASRCVLHAAAGALHPLAEHPPSDAGAGLVVFTSGTTGQSRGAWLDLSALEASAASVVHATSLRPGDRWLSPLPFAHVGGIGVLVRCLQTGATASVMDGFDPAGANARLRCGTTHASFVGRMVERLLADVGAAPAFPDDLRFVLVGGGPVPPALLARARAAGLPAVATYGLTEAGSTVTLADPAQEPSPRCDAGRPLPGRRVRLARDGTIEVAGPTLMRGYDGEPPLPMDGWFSTGDLGEWTPDGRLRILDRRVDLIVSGGENVYPAEVEGILARHPSIDEIALVAWPDPSWGQRVVGVVRWRGAPEEAGVAAFAAAELTPPQRPRTWITAAEPLPRNALGKLDRLAIRARWGSPLLPTSPDQSE